MINVALAKNDQMSDMTTHNGRLLAHVLSFTACTHATCPSMGLPCSGIHSDPIGIEVCSFRTERIGTRLI